MTAIPAAKAVPMLGWFSMVSTVAFTGGNCGSGGVSGGGDFGGKGCSCGGGGGGSGGDDGDGTAGEGDTGGKRNGSDCGWPGGGFGSEGGASGGGVVGGALVSTTVWVGAVTTRPVRLATAAKRVVEIVLASTLLAWACTALLWFCSVA